MSRYIDADELIVDMRHDYNTFPSAPQYGVLVSVYGVSMKQIENAPTIEPKRGEWRFDEKGYFFCSECKRKPNDQYATTDFCPNCGADMREREGE